MTKFLKKTKTIRLIIALVFLIETGFDGEVFAFPDVFSAANNAKLAPHLMLGNNINSSKETEINAVESTVRYELKKILKEHNINNLDYKGFIRVLHKRKEEERKFDQRCPWVFMNEAKEDNGSIVVRCRLLIDDTKTKDYFVKFELDRDSDGGFDIKEVYSESGDTDLIVMEAKKMEATIEQPIAEKAREQEKDKLLKLSSPGDSSSVKFVDLTEVTALQEELPSPKQVGDLAETVLSEGIEASFSLTNKIVSILSVLIITGIAGVISFLIAPSSQIATGFPYVQNLGITIVVAGIMYLGYWFYRSTDKGTENMSFSDDNRISNNNQTRREFISSIAKLGLYGAALTSAPFLLRGDSAPVPQKKQKDIAGKKVEVKPAPNPIDELIKQYKDDPAFIKRIKPAIKYVNNFPTLGKDVFGDIVQSAIKYFPELKGQLKQSDLIVLAAIENDLGVNRRQSSKGALGLMQVTPVAVWDLIKYTEKLKKIISRTKKKISLGTVTEEEIANLPIVEQKYSFFQRFEKYSDICNGSRDVDAFEKNWKKAWEWMLKKMGKEKGMYEIGAGIYIKNLIVSVRNHERLIAHVKGLTPADGALILYNAGYKRYYGLCNGKGKFKNLTEETKKYLAAAKVINDRVYVSGFVALGLLFTLGIPVLAVPFLVFLWQSIIPYLVPTLTYTISGALLGAIGGRFVLRKTEGLKDIPEKVVIDMEPIYGKEGKSPIGDRIAEQIIRSPVVFNELVVQDSDNGVLDKENEKTKKLLAQGGSDKKAFDDLKKVGRRLSPPVERYTLYVSSDFCSKKEFNRDDFKYDSRFDLKLVYKRTAIDFAADVLRDVSKRGIDPETVVVQLPIVSEEESGANEIKELKEKGIRFVSVDIEEFQCAFPGKSEKEKYRENVYAMMLLVRKVSEGTDDLMIKNALKIYFKNFIDDMDKEDIMFQNYLKAIISGDIPELIKFVLKYTPMEAMVNDLKNMDSETLIFA